MHDKDKSLNVRTTGHKTFGENIWDLVLSEKNKHYSFLKLTFLYVNHFVTLLTSYAIDGLVDNMKYEIWSAG